MPKNNTEVKPVLHLKASVGGTEIKLYALKEGQKLKVAASTKNKYLYGPCLVYETHTTNGSTQRECSVDDAQVWEWIGRLIKDGLKETDIVSRTE